MFKRKHKKIFYTAVILLFLFFALLNTYPLIKNINTHQLGDGGDGLVFMWNLQWVKTSLMDLHQNPYYVDNIFYPNGTDLYLHSLVPILGFVSIPLHYLFENNLILIYNILAIFTFILSGLGMFLLAFHVTKNKSASIIAGYIFAFSPYVLGHTLGHLNLMSIGFIPLFILYFIKFHEKHSLSNMALSSLFLTLVTLSSLYYGVFMFLFSLLYEIFYLIIKKFRVQLMFIVRLSSIFAMYFLALFPILLGIFRSKISGDFMNDWNPNYWSPDVITFFIPGTISKSAMIFTRYDWWQNIVRVSNMGAENQNFLGYTVMILSLIGFITLVTKRMEKGKFIFSTKYYTIFFSIFALVSFTFALGTKLKFLGNALDINLPYYYVYKIIPLVSLPGRFTILIVLSLAILTAIGLTNLTTRLSSRKKILLYVFVLVFIFAEFSAVPYRITSFPVPEFYYNLAEESGDFAIYDLSHRYESDGKDQYIYAAGIHMYYQTIHHKQITDGAISRMNVASFNYAQKGPPISDLDELGIKYVILPTSNAQRVNDLSNLLSNKFNFPIIYRDDKIFVYKIF